MSAADNQPDWERIAEKFDLWLPHLESVTEAMIPALQMEAGDRVLDVACGTGEPALTLARGAGNGTRIIAIDTAPGMVAVARAKAEREGLDNLTFRVMPAERMDFVDYRFDRLLCRFGLMLFEDPLKGLKEMHRVLRPGGRFVLTVWSSPETMRTLCWAMEAFRGRIDEACHPPLEKVTSLGSPETLKSLLRSAGFEEFHVERRELHYRFSSFDHYWDTVEISDILKAQYDALPEEEHGCIRETVRELARNFIEEGGLVVPHEYLMVTGVR